MTARKESPISEASTQASNSQVIGWFFLGYLLGPIGILIAYLRSPKAPVHLLADYTGDDLYLCEKTYVDTLKARQVKSTWIGWLVWGISAVFAIVLAIILTSQT